MTALLWEMCQKIHPSDKHKDMYILVTNTKKRILFNRISFLPFGLTKTIIIISGI